MKEHDYSKNNALLECALKVIPNAIPGHFNPVVQKPQGTYPFYCSRADGARFWDIDNNEYIDFMCAYGPMILGYGNSVVDDAVPDRSRSSDRRCQGSPGQRGP